MLKVLCSMIAALAFFASSASACEIESVTAGCSVGHQSGCIQITWDVDDDGCTVTNVKIERKLGAGSWALVTASSPSSPSYVDCPPAAGFSDYTYRVTITCSCGGEMASDSAESNPINCN